ncbi:hypothetical protein WEB32_12525 [Streptomyces netropsis]|uniref:Uncharacterized protein n=1 Tax=Streptomyces netropsis TaxID=55404 RepID=A0A7W7L5M4_STRNE|nr:hypothetical protein [Streptomyces netropsis]MBB4884130.1 hypothetical protein [Streptomyces netropsis]GGR05882.1 hypothetical protein GCM10010219_07890 [Streptomyces netropsis]
MHRRLASIIVTSCTALAFAVIGATPSVADPGPISEADCRATNGVTDDIDGTYYCLAVHGVIEGAGVPEEALADF